jgi:hypothetical protein
MRLIPLAWSGFMVLAFSACASYKLGPTSGMVAGEKSIQVNFFRNDTFEPRLIEYVASTLRRNLQQEGTYHLNTSGDGDIIVNGVITEFIRSELSFQPTDVITPKDYRLRLVAKVTAIERISGRILLDREVSGRTSLRVGNDLSSAERQAMPLLADDFAKNVTSLLVDGSW